MQEPVPAAYWSTPAEQLLRSLQTTPAGLDALVAGRRLQEVGWNAIGVSKRRGVLRAFFAQLSNPLAALLFFAAVAASFAREWSDAIVVIAILLLGATLSFAQERRASRAVEGLRARVALRSEVLRDGAVQSIDASRIVPGDVVLLSAGSLVPADGIVLAAKDCYVSQAVLTGETFPVDKAPGIAPEDASLADRHACLFLGTSVRSGTARMLVVRTGARTEYGQIAERLALRPAETDFDRGIRRFGHMLTRVMFVLVMFTTTASLLGNKPPVESIMFAIALAVGLAPEMLPAVIAINLSRGAQAMARRGVIVKKLAAIENFGAMDVLCTDKTGTLTEGRVTLESAKDARARESRRVLELAVANACLQTGLKNPLDEAIVAAGRERAVELTWTKVDELPYDFVRKRLSVVVRQGTTGPLLVTKGALDRVLEVCTAVRVADGGIAALDDAERSRIRSWAERCGEDGIRVLGLSSRAIGARDRYAGADESEMVFEGTLAFRDPPKAGAIEAIRDLSRLGVGVKIVSGDSRAVAVHLARVVGMPSAGMLTGADLARMRDEALWHAAERTNVFAEVDPNQKERVILALRKTGHVVGYMGDGINDAPAMHAADVSISVEGASDVAREAADFVLLRRHLEVLRDGILEGRRTFANTLKYLFTTESANFGNMVSMAVAAVALPFLPLLASQVLLNNFLSDVPAMAIASDAVDPEQIERPRRWDMTFLRRFMTGFGLVSTGFDLLTFAALMWLVGAHASEFRTGWFLESLVTEVFVALVVRTRRPFYASRPSRLLVLLSAAVAVVAFALPYTPVGALVDLVPLPPATLSLLLLITVGYVVVVEIFKRLFYAHIDPTRPTKPPRRGDHLLPARRG